MSRATVRNISTALGFSRTYELPLAKGYVRHWGLAEAVRELLQNALDSESPFEYEWVSAEDGWVDLLIRSRYTTLSPSTLLLGNTAKAEATDKIGSFGEGYKIAMLVLVRAGYDVWVYNGDRIWTPYFRESRQFGAEVLCVRDEAASAPNEGLTFRVHGLSPDDCAQIVETCLPMQQKLGECIEAPQGRILLERPGKLYVGGLFVCETQLKFGYDVKPEFLRLERDRQTVSSFDLKWLTKAMWFDVNRPEQVGRMISEDVPDLEYANYDCPEVVKEVCYKIFREKHPGKVAAKNQEEAEQFIKQGMREVVVLREAYHGAVTSSPSYKSEVVVKLRSPHETLVLWLEANRMNMNDDGIKAFGKLLEEATKWKI